MAAFAAQQAEIHVQFGKTGNYVEIEQVIDPVSVPSTSRNKISTTAYGASDTSHIPGGVRDHSELSFTLLYDESDSDHTGIRTSLNAGNVDSWRVRIPKSSTAYEVHTFDGFVESITPTLAMDGAVQWQVSVSLSGGITIS